MHCWSNGCNPSYRYFLDSRRAAHQPSTIHHSKRTTSLCLSTGGYCQQLQISDVTSIDNLMSKHEEADFRLMVHAKHAIDSNSPVIIRWLSADTNTFVMALKSFYSTNLILDSGTGAGRKTIRMSDVEIEEDNRDALISFHPFTRCEQISSFFHKRKTTSWKTMNSKSRFKEVMTRLGENNSVDDDLYRTLGKCVYIMHGDGRATDINGFRSTSLLWSITENKYVGLSV